jgi:hypothetical protein
VLPSTPNRLALPILLDVQTQTKYKAVVDIYGTTVNVVGSGQAVRLK